MRWMNKKGVFPVAIVAVIVAIAALVLSGGFVGWTVGNVFKSIPVWAWIIILFFLMKMFGGKRR